MPSSEAGDLAKRAQREFERTRDRVWLERVRVGLDYRRSMREIDERVARVRLERDRRVREAVAAGASYREVAGAVGLSHSRVQQIVNEGAKGSSRATARRSAR